MKGLFISFLIFTSILISTSLPFNFIGSTIIFIILLTSIWYKKDDFSYLLENKKNLKILVWASLILTIIFLLVSSYLSFNIGDIYSGIDSGKANINDAQERIDALINLRSIMRLYIIISLIYFILFWVKLLTQKKDIQNNS